MDILSTLATNTVEKVVSSVGQAFDGLFTSDEERLQKENDKLQLLSNVKVTLEQFAQSFEATVTERWKSDNEHFITRLTRPAGFVYTYLLFGVVMICDGNIGNFHINPAYIPLLETLLVTYTVAYVGSRGAEKISSVFKGK